MVGNGGDAGGVNYMSVGLILQARNADHAQRIGLADPSLRFRRHLD